MATRTLIVRSTTGPAATDSELEEAQSEVAASPNIAYRLAYIEERKGDRDAALAWLARAPLRDAHQQWSLLFWPDAAGLRTEPAFFRKMADVELVRSWFARGKWPDFCPEPGLKYDCAAEAAKLGFKSTRS